MEPLGLLGGPRDPGASQCLQITASTRPSQETYKYGVRSAAKSVHPSTSSGQAAPFRKQNNFCSPTPGPVQTSLASTRTMSYHDSWPLHHPVENRGVQSHHGRVSVSESPQLMAKQETMRGFPSMNCGQERDPQPTTRLFAEYRAHGDSQASVVPSVSTPCTEPLLCQRYPDYAASTPSSTSSLPQPDSMLHSQQPEMPPPVSPWHPAPVQSPVYQYSAQETPPHHPPVWWDDYAVSSRNVPIFSQDGYRNIPITSAPQQHQLNADSPHHMLQNNGMMMQLVPSTEVLSIQEPSLPTSSSLPASDPVAVTSYSTPNEPVHAVHDSLPRIPFCENPNRNTLPPYTPSALPLQVPRRMSTEGVNSPAKAKVQTTGPHRRHNSPRKSCTPTAAASSGLKGARVTTGDNNYTTNGASRGSTYVSFVNFTPEDKHKLLRGVARSGSSKTKARREQEAREKRQAALLAVENAGGDVEAVKAVLFGQG